MTTSDFTESIVTYPHITFSEHCDEATYGLLLDNWHVVLYLTDGTTVSGAVEYREPVVGDPERSLVRVHDNGELHFMDIDWSRVVRMVIV